MNTIYRVTLKAPSLIKRECDETSNGEVGRDGVAYNPEILKLFKGTSTYIEGFTKYERGLYAVCISKEGVGKTYVHPEWIKCIDGMPVVKGWFDNPKKYAKVTDELSVRISSNKLVPTTTLPTCSCGAIVPDEVQKGYDPMCEDCINSLTERHSYSYTPNPLKFKGEQLKGDEDTPLHFGLEIEVACDRTKLAHFMKEHKYDVYLKSDSSIAGKGYRVEIVSVPHTFRALMDKDSYLHTISMLDVKENENNGLHIHISRSGFVDDKHYGLFYFLLHEMSEVSTHIGGRGLTNYCKLTPTGRIHSKGNRVYNFGSRAVYLNEQNADTVEARFFIGTTDTDKIKSMVQYIESIIKYTKYHRRRVTASGWFAYISKKSNKYAELLKMLNGYDTSSLKDIKVSFSLPKTKLINPLNIKASDIQRLLKILTKGGNEIEVEDPKDTQLFTSYIRFRRGNNKMYEIEYKDIKHIIVEKE